MNYEELRDWCADARRSVERELDRLQEQQRWATICRCWRPLANCWTR